MLTATTARPLLGRSCMTNLNVETPTAKMREESHNRSFENTDYMTSFCEAAKKTGEFKTLCNTLLHKLEYIQGLNEETNKIYKKEKEFLEKVRAIVEDKLLCKLNEKLMDPKVDFDMNNLIENLVTFVSLIFRQYWSILTNQVEGLRHSYKRGFDGRHPIHQQPSVVNWRTQPQVPGNVCQNPMQNSNVPLYVAPPLRHREAVISSGPVHYMNVPSNIQRPSTQVQANETKNHVNQENFGWKDICTVRNEFAQLVKELAQQKNPEEMKNCSNISTDNLGQQTQAHREVKQAITLELAGTPKEPKPFPAPVTSENIAQVPENSPTLPLEVPAESNKISKSPTPTLQAIKMSPMQLRLNKVRQNPATTSARPKEESFTAKHATLAKALDSVSKSNEDSSKVLEKYKASLRVLGELNDELKKERKSKTYSEHKEENKTKQVDALADAYLHIEEMRERNELLKALMEKAESNSPISCAKRKREAFTFGQTESKGTDPAPINHFAFTKKEFGSAAPATPAFTVPTSNPNFFKNSFAPAKADSNFNFVPFSSDPSGLTKQFENLGFGMNGLVEKQREPVRFTFGQKKTTPLNANFNFTKTNPENKITPFPNFNYTKEALPNKTEAFLNVGFLKTPVLEQFSKPLVKSEPITSPHENSDYVRPIAKPVLKLKRAIKVETQDCSLQDSTPVANSNLNQTKLNIRKDFVVNNNNIEMDFEPVKNLIPSGMIQPPQTEPIKTEPSTVVSKSLTQKSKLVPKSSTEKELSKSEPEIINKANKSNQDLPQKAVVASSMSSSSLIAQKELVKDKSGIVNNNTEMKPIQDSTQKDVLAKSVSKSSVSKQKELVKNDPGIANNNMGIKATQNLTQNDALARSMPESSMSAKKEPIKSIPGKNTEGKPTRGLSPKNIIANNNTGIKAMQNLTQNDALARSMPESSMSAKKEPIKIIPGKNTEGKPTRGLSPKNIIVISTPNKSIQNEPDKAETKSDTPQRTIVTRSMSRLSLGTPKTPEMSGNNAEKEPIQDSPNTSASLQEPSMHKGNTNTSKKQDFNSAATSQSHSQPIPVMVTTGPTVQTVPQTTGLTRQGSFVRRPSSSPVCGAVPKSPAVDTDFLAAHRKRLMSADDLSPQKPDDPTEENVDVVRKLLGPSTERKFRPIEEQHIRSGGKYYLLFNFLKKQLPYGKSALLSALSHVKHENHGELSFLLKTDIASRMRKWLELNVPCVICNSSMDPEGLRVLWCDHTFHDECITKWLKTNFTCPICRTHMP